MEADHPSRFRGTGPCEALCGRFGKRIPYRLVPLRVMLQPDQQYRQLWLVNVCKYRLYRSY